MGQSKSKPTKKQERCPADRYGVPMGQCGEGQCCVWKCKDGNFDYANNTRCADGRHDAPRNDPRWSYLDKTTSRATSSGEMPQSFEAMARNMTTAYETDFTNAGAFYADWAVATDNWGGGNWEYEAYEPKAVSVGGGNGLVITATVGSTKQNVGTQADGSPMKYQAAVTSGKVQLKRTGIPSGACSFRCRFTPGKGLWPACWMLPLWNGKPVGIGQGFEPGDPEWPATGEIDVMEGKGSTPRWTVQTFHYGRDWNHWGYTNVESSVPDLTREFHEFSVAWDMDGLLYFIDDKPTKYFSFSDPATFTAVNGNKTGTVEPNPFVVGTLFSPVINLAYGGNFFSGTDELHPVKLPGWEAVFPAQLIVQRVRLLTWNSTQPGILSRSFIDRVVGLFSPPIAPGPFTENSFEGMVRHMTPVYETTFDDPAAFSREWVAATEWAGGGNGELQVYDPSRAAVVSGKGLVITAIAGANRENMRCTSAKVQLVAKSISSGAISFMGKSPRGFGLWPAMWMLPLLDHPYGIGYGAQTGATGWPACGEIDVFEGKGSNPNYAAQTIHYGRDYQNWGYTGEVTTNRGSHCDSFREYSAAWDAYGIAFFIDNRLTKYFSFSDPKTFTSATGSANRQLQPNPFVVGTPFSPIINLAYGGNFFSDNPPETKPNDMTVFPAEMVVRRVRMWAWSTAQPAMRSDLV